MESIVLTEGAFYKLKARMLELSIQQDQIAQMTALVARKRIIAYEDAGLDSALAYSMDDATLSVIERVSESATLDGTGK